jgi:acetoin utilization protein AcuB
MVSGMRIEAWMKHPVHVVKPRDSVRHAREVLERHRINQLPVVVDGRLVGILTDRDLRDAFPSVFDAAPVRAPKRPPAVDPADIAVEHVMTANTLTLGPKDTLLEAARLMRRERIGAVPIVEASRLVGILTRSDLLDAFVELVTSAAHAPAAGRSL